MQHPDDGALQAFLDGELTNGEHNALQAHVNACEPCAAAVLDLKRSTAVVAQALATLDTEPALEGVRSSIHRRAASQPVRPNAFVPWARAAVLVLLFGGAASAAIPGSPLRGFVDSIFGGGGVAPSALTESDAGTQPEEMRAFVGVAAAEGVVRIVLSEVTPGAEVEVAFVDGDVASVTAAETALFSTAPGLLEVTGAGAPIRVEIPRGVEGASVVVDGTLFLRKAGARIELAGPTEDSTATEILFRVPR